MDFKYIYLFALVICLPFKSVIGQDQSTQKRSLQSCVELALERNLALQNRSVAAERAALGYATAWQGRLPSLNATLRHGLNEGKGIDPSTNQFISNRFTSGNQELSTSMVLFDGLGMLYDIRQQAKWRDAAQKEQEGTAIALKLDVILAYIQIWTAQDILTQATTNMLTTEAQLSRATTLHGQGAIAPSDYFDIKGQYAAEASNVNTLKKAVFERRVALASLMNIAESDLGELASLSRPLDEITDVSIQADQLYQSAQTALPEYQALELKMQAATYAVKYAKSAYYPKLTFGAGLNSQYSGTSKDSYIKQVDNNLGKYLSFGLSIPIFNGFKVRNQVRDAKLNYRNQQIENDQKNLELLEKTTKTVFDYRQSFENIRLLNEQVQDYRESFRIAQVRFDEGDINSVTYIIAKNKYEQAMSQLTIAEYQLTLQRYTMDYYHGKLGF